MSASLFRYYNYQSFEFGKIASAFRYVMSSFGLTESEISFSATYRFEESGDEDRDISLDEIGSILELRDRPRSLSISFYRPNRLSDLHFLILSNSGNFLHISVHAPTAEVANKLCNNFVEALALIRAYPKIGEEDDQAQNSALSCFLSYRFNPRSNIYAAELMKFLALIGVEVETGAGYEPRRVSDKVLSHLDKPLDFVIYLIEKEGESTWIRDEMAVSLGKGYHIIPLVEEGSTLERGILGDLEYIPFNSGHISDAFISILEAIKFINKKKEPSQINGT